MVLNDALFRLKKQQCERNEVWIIFIFLRSHACLNNVAQPIMSQTVADDGVANSEMCTCVQIWVAGVH